MEAIFWFNFRISTLPNGFWTMKNIILTLLLVMLGDYTKLKTMQFILSAGIHHPSMLRESFYSFESDDKDSEKRITFGSLKSILEEDRDIDANERK